MFYAICMCRTFVVALHRFLATCSIPLWVNLVLRCSATELGFFFFFSHLGHAGTRPSAACVWNWALCREESSIIRAAFYLKTITWAEVFLWGFDASRAQLSLKWWDLLLSQLSPFLRTPGTMRRRRTVTLHDGSVWNARDGLMEATCVFTVSVDPVLKKKIFFHLYSTWSLTVVCNFMRWDNLTHHMVHWFKPCFSGEFRGGKSQRISGQTLSFMFKQVNEIFYCQFRTYWRSCWSQELGRGGQEM